MATQNQMLLPLLDALEDSGGKEKTFVLYDKIAERLDIHGEERNLRVIAGKAGEINVFERSVRFAQQRAKLMGLANPEGDQYWAMTGKGEKALHEASPGKVVTLFVTEKGVALWGSCEDAIGYLDDESVQLFFTSPPYPLLRQKQYGNLPASDHIEWLLRNVELWLKKIAKDGSIVINLADVYNPGEPSISLYQDKLLTMMESHLGLKLCQRFAWLNPSKLPSPAQWVTIERVRVKSSLEQIYWLSPSSTPFADNRAVLRPYSKSMEDRIKSGGERGAKRPSGHQLSEGAFGVDNGGAIPDNLIIAPNTESNSSYIKACKSHGLPVHPARFPRKLPDFFISFLTRVGDLVCDPLGGSAQTGASAEELGRYWVVIDKIREYLEGGYYRFPGAKKVAASG
ncbi:MAG: DNA-methyltransferase [Dissulfurispiraceae bacterium]